MTGLILGLAVGFLVRQAMHEYSINILPDALKAQVIMYWETRKNELKDRF